MEMELAAEGYRLKVSVRKIDTGNDDITVTFLGVGKRATMLVATSSAQLKARNME